jgi:pSer/pThr/pTyr-binding forkhead associated (FHA) protein/outer membrane protein assembly factor BamB
MARIILRKKAEVISEYRFKSRKNITIGSSKKSTIVVPDKNISENHCSIIQKDNHFELQDNKSMFGTKVNGRPVTVYELQFGDTVSVGEYSLEFKQDAAAGRKFAQGEAPRSLLGIYGNFEGKKYELKLGENLIGRELVNPRGEANDIVLYGDMTVSKGHAKISCSQDRCTITDIGSTGGVAVNGEKLGQFNTANIAPGDEVTIARTVFRLCEGDAENYARPKRYDVFILKIARGLVFLATTALYFAGAAAVYKGFEGISIINNKPRGFSAELDSKWQPQSILPRQIPAEYDIAASPAMADVNNDGVNDIVFFDPAGQLSAFDGKTGQSVWKAAEIFNSGKSSPAIEDVNGDGIPDIIAVSDSSTLYIIDGKSGSEILKETLGGNVSELSPAARDLNGDGKTDIVVASEDGMIHFIYSAGFPGLKEKFTEFLDGPIYASPVIVNSDQISPVVVICSYNGSAYVMDGKSRTKRTLNLTEKTGKAHMMTAPPAVGDINNDGMPEIVVVSNVPQYLSAISLSDFKVLWTYFVEPVPAEGLKHTSSPIVADVTGDGKGEVVFFSSNEKMYILKGDTGYPSGELLLKYDLPDCKRIIGAPAKYDLNKDNIDEILVGGEKGYLYVLSPAIDAGDVKVLEQIQFNGAPITSSPVIGDLDGDGMLDIVYADITNSFKKMRTNVKNFKNAVIWQSYLGNAEHSGALPAKMNIKNFYTMMSAGFGVILALLAFKMILRARKFKKRPKVVRL